MEASTVFVIAITTTRMFMPGMPTGMKIPGMADLTAPTRTMTMDLTSDKKADSKAVAECSVPQGLKIGPKAILDIDRPQKVADSGEPDKTPDKPEKMPDFTIKFYWTSSQTVLSGQPKIIDSKSMSVEMQKAMAKDPNALAAMKKAMSTVDEGSHAYWPGSKAKPLAKDASCPGNYNLTTNYCGGTSITLDKPQDFLAPIDITSLGKGVDLSKYITVEWKPVQNAAAYLVNAFGAKEKLMVMWTSASEATPNLDVTYRAISKEQLDKYIKNGTLLAPDKTKVFIPEGIFQEVGNAMLTITAIGVDKTQLKDGIQTQVIVRSNAMATLGKGMMGMDEEEDEDAAEKPDTSEDNSGDVVDKADETVGKGEESADKVDKAKDVLKRGRDLLKKRW